MFGVFRFRRSGLLRIGLGRACLKKERAPLFLLLSLRPVFPPRVKKRSFLFVTLFGGRFRSLVIYNASLSSTCQWCVGWRVNGLLVAQTNKRKN